VVGVEVVAAVAATWGVVAMAAREGVPSLV